MGLLEASVPDASVRDAGAVDGRGPDGHLLADAAPLPDASCEESCADSGVATGCPQAYGAPMLRVTSAAGVPFCIDSTEATQADYEAFRNGANVDDQDPLCSWNGSFTPHPSLSTPYDPVHLPDIPVTDIDFCDALAFCAWEGKHLCGQISTDGGYVDGGLRTEGDNSTSADDPNLDQWFAACGGPGGRSYPYGGSFANVCNVAPADGGMADVAAVGSFPGCLSTSFLDSGSLYDMSGNVEEWTDRCALVDGSLASCIGRGGSFGQTGDQATCTMPVPDFDHPAPTSAYDYLGVRCCADLPPNE